MVPKNDEAAQRDLSDGEVASEPPLKRVCSSIAKQSDGMIACKRVSWCLWCLRPICIPAVHQQIWLQIFRAARNLDMMYVLFAQAPWNQVQVYTRVQMRTGLSRAR